MEIYVVQNQEGLYFKPTGLNGTGEHWNESLEDAKFYTKLGQAKRQVTFYFNQYPEYGCPKILVFDLKPEDAVVLDMEAETRKKAEKKKKQEQEREIRWRQEEIERLQKEQDNIKRRLKKLE